MRSATSDLVEVPHHASVTRLGTRRRSVPVVGLVSFGDVQLDPHDGTVGVRGLADTSHLMSAQRG